MSWPLPVSHPRVLVFDLDPALPGMVRVLNAAGVASRFQRHWPHRGRSPAVTACVLQHVRWTPGVECAATYRLAVADGATVASTIGVVVISPDTVRHRLFAPDEDLPGLAAAADPTVMGPWLAERLGRSVHSCSVTPVNYRPGERCVLRYELEDGVDRVLYGKVLSGDRVADLASTITSLGDQLVAPLVGVAPEWQLAVQADAGARSLGSVGLGTPSDEELMELYAGGRLLGRLHARSGPPGRHRSVSEDAAELTQYMSAAEWVSPPTAALVAKGIKRARARGAVTGTGVPSHGAFRLNQVRLGAARPLLIDLDTFCWADPARDVGNALAYLRWREIRHPDQSAALARVRTAFLAGHQRETMRSLDEDLLAAFEGVSLLKIAGRRFRNLAFDEWERVPELVDAALARLGAAGS